MSYRILILTKGYARYRENLVSGTAAALPDNYRIYHSTPQSGEELWEVDWESLLANGGPVTHVNFPKIDFRTFFSALKSRWFPKAMTPGNRLEDLAPDLVMIQEYSVPMLKAALYCRLRGIPCVVSSDLGRDSDWSQFPKQTRLIHALGAHLTTGVVAHTQTARTPVSLPGRPTVFIPHSVDITHFHRSPATNHSGRVKLLMVAQYIPRKGHDLLAKAARILIDRGIRDFEIRLVGTQDPAWVHSVIRAEHLEDYMPVTGVLKGDALLAEFNAAGIFVLTSRFDTFAVVVHEAAAFGLPLLISKYAESSALMVKHGINGFVIDPYDVNQLADHLEELIVHPEMRHRMGVESRIIAEKLCASKTGASLADWLVRHVHPDRSSAHPTPGDEAFDAV
jgi:glycosyltransferase involved in cell wall biosynthesis